MKQHYLGKRLVPLALAFLTFMANAQVPIGYYDSAEGKTGAELKSTLNSIISGHTTYPYTSSNTDVWDILKEADKDPNNSANVIGIYSGFSMDAAAEYASGAGWNREHVWAKSRGDFGTSQGPGTDCHHLAAADVSTNSARSNRNFDAGDFYYIDGSGNYSGSTLSKTSSVNFVWEPRDEMKGDVARMILYMATRYEGDPGEPDLELTTEYQTNTAKEPLHAEITALISWHQLDPVSEAERRRNDVIYSFQNNRNPYIDHPEYVCLIYTCDGSNSAPEFSSTPVASITEGEFYNYNIVTTDVETSDALSISVANNPVWLSFVDNGDRTATLSGTPTTADVGSYSITLSVSDGMINTDQMYTLTVAPIGGGGLAVDLFISEYIEGSSYNKGIELANFTGSSIDLSGYSLQKQTNGAGTWGSELVLSGTLADAQVYVVVNSQADPAMQSVADLITGASFITFNGNDAVGLFKSGVLMDILGTFDGGTGDFAKDVTLVRNQTITSPNVNYTLSEWDSFASNTFSDLGIHNFNGGTTPTICDDASGLSASNIGINSADLNWSVSTAAISNAVRYREVGNPSWINTSSSTNDLSLSGLVSSTNYEYQVQPICESSSAAFTPSFTFSTLADPCNEATGLTTANITTSSADLGWGTVVEAQSYNVQYRVLASSTWTSTISSTNSLALTGLVDDTNYEYQVQTVCSNGTASFSASFNFSTEPIVQSGLFVQSFFESGWDGWSDGGSDAARYSGSRSYEGSYSIRLRDNSGIKSSMTSPSYDLSTFTQVDLEFYFYPYSMENGEDFWLMYNDGSGWQTVQTYSKGTDFENNSFYVANVSLSSANYNLTNSGQFRFQVDASNNADHVYIDQVTINANSSGTLAARVFSNPRLSIKSITPEEVSVTGLSYPELTLFPNPAISKASIRVELEENVDLNIQFFDTQGRIILKKNLTQVEGTVFHSFDVSALNQGVYFVSIVTSDGLRQMKKLLIQK